MMASSLEQDVGSVCALVRRRSRVDQPMILGVAGPPASGTLRALSVDSLENAGHGHKGTAMGTADIAVDLYTTHLKFDASSPKLHDRDRIARSNGPAAIFLYSLLVLTGVPGKGSEGPEVFPKVEGNHFGSP